MKKAYIAVDIAFGDSGKGTIVESLCEKYNVKLVTRFNGGSQALHHVVRGKHTHGFRQFGAGTFAGAETLLSKHVLVNPVMALHEAEQLWCAHWRDMMS